MPLRPKRRRKQGSPSKTPSGKQLPTARVVFRDKRGRFLNPRDRYSDKVGTIQVIRMEPDTRDMVYYTVAKRKMKPEDLADVLSHREFESMPEAVRSVRKYTSGSKYKAWDISEQIDRTKGIRRKSLKFTVTIQDGKRTKQLQFYHNVKRNTPSSYAIFRRINQELGFEGYYLYKTAGGKMLADRKGTRVKLVNIAVEEII